MISICYLWSLPANWPHHHKVRILFQCLGFFQNTKKKQAGIYLDVSKNRGTLKCMVYNGNLIKMDGLGVPLFLETPISKGLGFVGTLYFPLVSRRVCVMSFFLFIWLSNIFV